MAYLTPNSLPADTICRVLFIPNNDEFLAIVTGALQVLTFPESFVQFGTLTPDQTADAYVTMFDLFCFNEGACRVIGEVIAFAGATSPDSRWLLCDGSSLLRVDYPDLFTVIGTTYGAVDGTHFNLPDLRGRAPIAAGSGPGLTPRAVGDSFGEEDHQLTVSELASHDHSIGNVLVLGTSAPPPFDALGPNPFSTVTGSTGGDTPHNNMQPSLAINYLIVALT